MGDDKTWWMIGQVTRTNQLDFGSGPNPDVARWWDTKRKLFSLEEVCVHSAKCHSSSSNNRYPPFSILLL